MEKRIIVILAVPFLLFWHWFEPAARRNQRGIRAYDEKKYEQALQEFLSARGIKPDAAVLKSNTAAALYQLTKYQEALEEFSRIKDEALPAARADRQYNMGNAAYRLQQWDKALEYYKKCLLAHPEDVDAKKNYELTLKKIQEQQQQPPSQQNQDQQQEMRQNPQNEALMQFVKQNEKEQLEKKKRPLQKMKREKDW